MGWNACSLPLCLGFDSWWWPIAGPRGQADGLRKAGLLKGYPYGVQPYENRYGNLRGTLK